MPKPEQPRTTVSETKVYRVFCPLFKCEWEYTGTDKARAVIEEAKHWNEFHATRNGQGVGQ